MPAAVSPIATVVAEQDGPVAQGPEANLRQVWAQITDSRDRRRHSLVVILALVQAAVVAGATSFAAIRHWIGATPQQVLADIGARQSRWTGEYQAPHPDTVCRVLQELMTSRCVRNRSAGTAAWFRRGRVCGSSPVVSVKLQRSSGIRGVGPAESTGKSRVRYCPGGRPGTDSRRRPPKPRDQRMLAQDRRLSWTLESKETATHLIDA
jgi:hypothetical protein